MPYRWRLQTNRLGPVGVDILWRPAEGDRSGDFFDLVDRRDGRVVVVLGDAPGHGPGAAAVGEGLRSRLRQCLAGGASLLEAVADLDRFIGAMGQSELLASVAAVEVDPAGGGFDVVNAGHPPLLVSSVSGAGFVEDRPDALLGIAGQREKHSHRLGRDSVLFLFSDGLIERPGGPPYTEGLELLVRAARGVSPAAAAPSVARAVTEVLGQPFDDATILSVHVGHGHFPPLDLARPQTTPTLA